MNTQEECLHAARILEAALLLGSVRIHFTSGRYEVLLHKDYRVIASGSGNTVVEAVLSLGTTAEASLQSSVDSLLASLAEDSLAANAMISALSNLRKTP